MTKKRDGKREKSWRRVLRRRAASGMTIADFCASEDLTSTAYYYWQREIRRRDEESQSPGAESTDRPALAAVRIIDDRGGMAAVEVVAKNGYLMRVGEQATAEHVRRVLQAVSELD